MLVKIEEEEEGEEPTLMLTLSAWQHHWQLHVGYLAVDRLACVHEDIRVVTCRLILTQTVRFCTTATKFATHVGAVRCGYGSTLAGYVAAWSPLVHTW